MANPNSKLYGSSIEVDQATGDVTIAGSLTTSGGTVVTGADLVAVTATAAEIDTLAAVTAGTTSASKALVVDSNKKLSELNITNLYTSVASKTAGTTQTQAGATAITSTITLGTTGNANDGYLLPAMTTGRILIIHNVSANAGKVYANGTETLNGTAGNAGSTALTASKTMIVFGTGAGTSVSAVMM